VFGLFILFLCVVSFYRHGKGTLAPWDPPKRLVVADLYRYTRNPMYVGVTLILLGWAGLLGSMWHYLYALLMLIAFHLRVVLYEEPEMARLFPEDWANYKKNVPRWLIRARPYRPEKLVIE
jgi:protein-S-isoprenylcysteine O-methyltransferase Ste14